MMSNVIGKTPIEPLPASETALEKAKVGLQGFRCPSGEERTFDYCIKKCAKRNECPPLPLLLSLMPDRERQPFRYGVTEILNPPQVVYYSRNKPYFATPEQLIWQTFGTAFHEITLLKDRVKELGLQDEYKIEEKFEKEFRFAEHMGKNEIWDEKEIKLNAGMDAPFITLSGRSDLYVTSAKSLWDFKTMKYYGVKKLKEGDWEGSKYHWQLNIYRVFQYPDTKKMYIQALVKDWSRYIKFKEGINPLERIEVPLIPDAQVKDTVKELLKVHAENQLDPSKLRECTDEERWKNKKGVSIRCEEYCGIREHCRQFQEMNNEK